MKGRKAAVATFKEQVFRVKKTRGTPMGRPKLELLASNDQCPH